MRVSGIAAKMSDLFKRNDGLVQKAASLCKRKRLLGTLRSNVIKDSLDVLYHIRCAPYYNPT